MRITETHIYFWGSIYSNFYVSETKPYLFKLDGYSWMSSEQYFMAQKALTFNDIEIFNKIVNTLDPGTAKKYGRRIKNYDEQIWSEKRYDIMKTAVFEKFNQNKDLKNKILNTGNKIFVEASPYDLIWGVGLYEEDDLILDEKNWNGLNLLGKVLNEVRNQIGG